VLILCPKPTPQKLNIDMKSKKVWLVPLTTLVLLLIAGDFVYYYLLDGSLLTHRVLTIIISSVFLILALISLIARDKLTKNYRTAALVALLVGLNFVSLAFPSQILRNLVYILVMVIVLNFVLGKK